VDECKHYYSGFKLLFLDVRVSSGIVWKVLNGYTLSRRESRYGSLRFAGSYKFFAVG
jgi:LETM1 and EF-hand domain-containing protein 1